MRHNTSCKRSGLSAFAAHIQVNVSDKVAGLMSDLAEKLLEAEASVNEATQMARSIDCMGHGGDAGQDAHSLKTKLMVNALMHKVRVI
jgi:hypothetical protein